MTLEEAAARISEKKDGLGELSLTRTKDGWEVLVWLRGAMTAYRLADYPASDDWRVVAKAVLGDEWGGE